MENPEPRHREIEAALRGLLNHLPEPHATEAKSFIQPVTFACPFRSMETVAPDASCLSGPAMLASDELWPTRHGHPLTFLARINFAQLPPTPHRRPPHGSIEIFYDSIHQAWGQDPSDSSGHAMIYHPDSTGLKPALAPGSGSHPPLRKPLKFSQSPEFNPSRDFQERYDTLLQEIDETTAEAVDDHYQTLFELCGGDGHRVLSLPVVIQNDMDDDLVIGARARGLPDNTRWTLLLQLDSDKSLNWSWGDSGFLYFWIPTEDLSAGRFDRSWVILQCC